MKLSIIVPVYHEEKNINKVLRKISQTIKTEHEIVVVYDDAKDPTYPVIKKYQIIHKQTLRLTKNIIGNGKGVMNAIKTGFTVAKGNAVVVVMADLSDDISQIDKMFKLIQKGYSVVCASRFMMGGKKIGGSFLKNLLSKAADISLHYLIGLPTHDATNAYKMYSKEFLDSITVESTGGFEYSLEITLKAFSKGLRITEIPTTWRDREAGKSNFQLRKWLPQYIKWYFWGLKEKFFLPGVYLLYIISAVFLTALYIGNQIREKIPVVSTLDLSWQTDAVERFLHGFIAGKDYIFTYGPLFQLIYSLPSKVFGVPSFVSIILATIFLSIFVAISILYISLHASETKIDKLLLPSLLLFVLGIIPQLSGNSGIRFLLPLVYALCWSFAIFAKRISFKRLLFLSISPSILGLYVYDLFPQTVLIGVLLLLFILLTLKERIRKKMILGSTFLIGIFVSQTALSFIISGGFSYIKNSLVTLNDYYYIMNTFWEVGKSNYLFFFPLVMVAVMIFLYKSTYFSSKLKSVLFILVFTSLTQLRTAFVRSDSGHILAAILPSILVCFILIYYLIKIKRVGGTLLFVMLFILVPFRDNYYGFLSAKNISAVLHVIKNGQNTSFQDIYTFPAKYKIYPEIFSFIASHKGEIMVYPYDSFLLNTQNTTYNTYALQLYGYSSSFVEKQTVLNLEKNPPKYILLQVDKQSTSPLDGIPNFTRNPLITMWMLRNYSVQQRIGSILLLQYDANKLAAQPQTSQDCKIWTITGDLTNHNFIDLLKPSQFYFVFNGALRLPAKPGVKEYTIIPSGDKIDALVQLFSSKTNFSTAVESQELEKRAKVVSVNFLNQVTFYDTKMYCLE